MKLKQAIAKLFALKQRPRQSVQIDFSADTKSGKF